MSARHRHQAIILLLSAMLSIVSLSSGPALAQNEPTTEELLKQIKLLEQRLHKLESQVQQQQQKPQTPTQQQQQQAQRQPGGAAPAQQQQTPPATTVAAAGPASSPSSSPLAEPEAKPPNKDLFGLAPSPIEGLKIGMYGELKYGTQQNPAAGGQWQTGFDAARIVLLPTYKFTDSIIFNAEIEFEHAGTGFDNDDKLHGTAEIEQAYVDFLVSKYLNVRSPGIDLVPMGYINQHHEPTQFYSVNRPELDNGNNNGIVPTTWASPAAGLYGKIVDGLNYQLQVSSAIEDFGDSFDARSDGNSVAPGPYIPGIDGINGMNASTPPRGDYRQLSNDLGIALRLAYEPEFLPGFSGSTSFYYTSNIEPRGAHDNNGNPLGMSSLAMFDTEFRYRPSKTNWEFRGEFALASFGDPAALRANNDGDPTDNVGSSMWGISGEVAYHFSLGPALGGDWEAVPFYRYTYMNKQTAGFAGSDANTPTGAGQQQFHTLGVAVFPTPELVFKLNYQKVIDASATGAMADSVLGGVGFHF
jgi:hypothetical protein